MARPSLRLEANAPGAFYVDSSCIDCGTCWQWDPDHFAQAGTTAKVWHQPVTDEEIDRALLAVQACPVTAIGGPAALLGRTPTDGFPALLTRHPAGDVHYCGWASAKSFGASSYLIVRPDGNVLIDSPRFNAPLARRIAALGGLAAIVLTHRDDVADHGRWADRFGCGRWIHRADADAAPEAEHLVEGEQPLVLDRDLCLIPTPGHTAGSMVALLGGQILFSGDHLWWSESEQAVVASRRYCWWDWPRQVMSVEKLHHLNVRWLLPGHGHRRTFAPGEWSRQLERTLAHCRSSG